MGRIWNKLRKRDGVSVLMGLVFLVVCMTLGTVVLTAAGSASGKLAELRQREQDYLTVSSAAALLKDRVGALTYTHTKTSRYINGTLGGTPTDAESLTAADGRAVILEAELKELCNVFTDAGSPVITKTFTVEADPTDKWDWETVHGSMRMEADGSLLIKLWLGDPDITDSGNHHKIEIEFYPDGPNQSVEYKNRESSPGVFEITATETTICSWPADSCTIRKGTF